jgi:hypothetical protein
MTRRERKFHFVEGENKPLNRAGSRGNSFIGKNMEQVETTI